MIKKVLIFTFVCTGIFNSCCKKELTPYMEIQYLNLSSPTNVTLYTINKGNPQSVINTIDLGEINDNNNYTKSLSLHDHNTFDFIIETSTNIKSDTINNLTIETKGFNCNEHVDNIQYNLNGVAKSGFKIVIP